jgi:hypothetical protein
VQAGEEVARLATNEIALAGHALRAVLQADHPLVQEMRNGGELTFRIGSGPWLTVPLGPVVDEQIRRCERLELSGSGF